MKPDFGTATKFINALIKNNVTVHRGMEFDQTPGLTQVGDLVAQMFGCVGEFRRSIFEIPA